MTEKDNFEKRLLSELRQVSAESPEPAPATRPASPRPYGRFVAVGAGLAAVVAGIAIYTSTGDNTPSAYAVEKQSDGKVAVEISNLEDATGLEASLAEAGVPAEVLPAEAICAVKIEPGSDEGTGTEPTSPAATVEPDGDVVKAVPATPAIPVEQGRTATPAGAPGAPVTIDLEKADPEGASFSIDPEAIAEGQRVIIAPTEVGKADKLIPAGAPSAPPIAVSIGAPGEPPC